MWIVITKANKYGPFKTEVSAAKWAMKNLTDGAWSLERLQPQ